MLKGGRCGLADAYRHGKRFIVRADEKLSAFLEVQSAIHEFRGKLLLTGWHGFSKLTLLWQ